MATIDQQFNSINDKLQQVLKQQSRLIKENEKLKEDLEKCKAQEAQTKQTIDELNQQIVILKSAAGALNEKDKKHFEKRLSQYIKDIDKCISFLSE